MYVYHEVDAELMDEILIDGIKQGTRGEKSQDDYIIQTDRLLDSYRPEHLKSQGVGRANNIYGYVAVDGKLVDIVDGELVDVDSFVADSSELVLRLEVEPQRCQVSDLDVYDEIKSSLENNQPFDAEAMAKSYWTALTPLASFDIGDIDRPEVMITHDIEPYNIEVCR